MKRLNGMWVCLALFWVAMAAQARTMHFYYTDPQGTVLAKTDAQGNILARYDYKPYGGVVSGQGPNGPGYTGHENDTETGLVYMQARYYDPVGRFLSPDPVGPGVGSLFGFNRYDYADNNPIINVDPTGMAPGDEGECLKSPYPCGISIVGGGGERSLLGRRAMNEANAALKSAGVLGREYKNLTNLVKDWAKIIEPISVRLQVEIGSDLDKKGALYLCSPAYSTGDSWQIDFNSINRSAIEGQYLVAEIHTHPVEAPFSGMQDWAMPWAAVAKGYGDLGRYYNEGIDGYVALPSGKIYGWSHKKIENEFNTTGNWEYLKSAIHTVVR